MAIVKGNVIGNLRGRLGNLSARTIYGQTVLAARPSSFKVNYDPRLLSIRSRFSVTAKFSSMVISLPALVFIWKKMPNPTKSVFNEIFQRNFHLSSQTLPTVNNIITPGGFASPVAAATVVADNVEVRLAPLSTVSTFTPEEVNLSVNAVLCYYNPSNPADPSFQLIVLNNEITNYNFTENYEVNLALNVTQQAIAAKYHNSILYFIVASKSADGKVVQNSGTYTKLS